MYTKIKGTSDILPEKAKQLSTLEAYLKDVVSLYGFEEIRTPIIESSELIHRSSGEGSDIVKKETYDFKDRAERMLTLRPEGTAPVVRAVIENKLYTRPLPLKLFYIGEMFRYERPQKGRYREFRQFGVEVVGSESPYMDAEVIVLADTIFRSLRMTNYKLKINTIGDDESRANYSKALKNYLADKLDTLCDDCKKRFETNTLRILDCKVDSEKDTLKNAPLISDYLSNNSKARFEVVKGYLNTLGIPFTIDYSLVRGLDYYTETVFEFYTESDVLGQAKTICAGGRYDNLVKQLDGPDLKCVGFSFGLERLQDALTSDNFDYSKKVIAQFIPLGVEAKAHLISLLQDIRHAGFSAEIDYDASSLKSHFKAAENNKARFIVILGSDELEKGTLKIKNKMTDTEEEIEERDLKNYLLKNLKCSGSCSSCEGGCREN